MNKQLENGKAWYGVDGNIIHAHGGYIIKHDNYYYWYGENRLDNIYVSCYRSEDLLNWEFRNNILTTKSPTEKIRVRTDLTLSKYDGTKKVNIERPKVLYNKLTKKFVLWAHYENGENYLDARAAIASCDTPDGNFVYHGSFNPYGYMSRDCTLFLDDDDSAYFISAARDNADLHIYKLDPDFLNVEKHINTLWQGEYREAPAVFKKDGKYYILSSHCTGWDPNQGKFSSSNSLEGSWEMLEDFGNETTFMSQPAFVLPVPVDGVTKYYYFGDRWGGNGENYLNSTYVVLEIKFNSSNKPYIEYSQYAFMQD